MIDPLRNLGKWEHQSLQRISSTISQFVNTSAEAFKGLAQWEIQQYESITQIYISFVDTIRTTGRNFHFLNRAGFYGLNRWLWHQIEVMERFPQQTLDALAALCHKYIFYPLQKFGEWEWTQLKWIQHCFTSPNKPRGQPTPRSSPFTRPHPPIWSSQASSGISPRKTRLQLLSEEWARRPPPAQSNPLTSGPAQLTKGNYFGNSSSTLLVDRLPPVPERGDGAAAAPDEPSFFGIEDENEESSPNPGELREAVFRGVPTKTPRMTHRAEAATLSPRHRDPRQTFVSPRGSAPLTRSADAQQLRRRASWHEQRMATVEGAREASLKDHIIFISRRQLKWYLREQEALPDFLAQLEWIEHEPSEHADRAHMTAYEMREKRILCIRDFLLLGYLMSLVPLPPEYSRDHCEEIMRVWLRLSNEIRVRIKKYYAYYQTERAQAKETSLDKIRIGVGNFFRDWILCRAASDIAESSDAAEENPWDVLPDHELWSCDRIRNYLKDCMKKIDFPFTPR